MDRRRFLSGSATAAAAILALRPPAVSLTPAQAQAAAGASRTLPPPSLYDRNEEAYWSGVRELFLIPKDEVYLNNGTCRSGDTGRSTSFATRWPPSSAPSATRSRCCAIAPRPTATLPMAWS